MNDPGPREIPFDCPECGGAFVRIMGGLRCQRCGLAFPIVDSLPCLFAQPDLWRTIWLRRLDDYSAGVEARIGALRQQLDGDGTLMPATRARLSTLVQGLAHQLEGIAALFEPLDVASDPLLSSVLPAGAEAGGRTAILNGYEHLFRDWAWGASEVEQARDFVAPLVPSGLNVVAFLGAGAGRLAVELHQALAPARTLAFEMNPLPALVAARLSTGEPVRLPEFPLEPRCPDDVVQVRELSRPFIPRDGFSLALADPLRPPVRPASVDAVVTAWFIDATPADPRQVGAIVNQVLRPGGLWVNVGPLGFHGDLARAYGHDEVLQMISTVGFQVPPGGPADQRDLPALQSPASGTRRTEQVYRFAARKVAEAAPVELPAPLPLWVLDPTRPIAITPGMVTLGRTSMFTTGVLGMIDGSRSVMDLARELGQAWGVEPARLQDELRAFLARIPD